MSNKEIYPVMATISAPAHRHLGSNVLNDAWNDIRIWMLNFINEHNVQTHVSMMAPGFDQVTDSAVAWSNCKTHLVIPCRDYYKPWPPAESEYAERITNIAETHNNLTIISDKISAKSVSEANKKIVEMADVIVAIDKDNSKIVAKAIERCKSLNKPMYLAKDNDIISATFRKI